MRKLFVAILALCAPNESWATGSEDNLRGHDLVMTVDSRWTGTAAGGYYPVRIRVVNRGPTRVFRFQYAADSGQSPTVERVVQIDQNATVKFTLAVPVVSENAWGRLLVFNDGKLLEQVSNLNISLEEKSATWMVESQAPTDITRS